jgi:hypothetical protein
LVEDIHYPKESLPNPMDVVWCRYPYAERPGVPGTTPHPCLVFGTNKYSNGYAVLVAFGTSSFTSKQAETDLNFAVSNMTEMHTAGLFKVTMFDLGRFKRLPWSPKFFEILNPKYSTPKIGCISTRGQDVLKMILRERDRRGLPTPK